MPILIAAVAVVGGLCLLDLLLTFGVIRRLREHTDLLSGTRNTRPPVTGLTAGQSPGAFSAVTTTGELVSGAAGFRVFAVFSSSCSACPEQVPPFMAYLSSNHIGRESVLAVVQDDDDAPPPYLDELTGVAQVCVEPTDGELTKAFDVRGTPAFYLLDMDGAVLASDFDPAVLPEPAAV
jgi:hypothetical protein